jgi:Fe-S oxidoreductase
MIRLSQFGLEGIEKMMWECSTCKQCEVRCPQGLPIIDVVKAARTVFSQGGLLPGPLRNVVGSLVSKGCPWGGEKEVRYDWMADRPVPDFGPDKENLYFTCCTYAYDPRNRKVGEATVEVLNKAGLSWGVVRTGEVCCGEAVNKMGETELFGKLKDTNHKLFVDHKATSIITGSPHCYHTFLKEYPGGYKVRHISQVLAEAVDSGKLKLSKSLLKKVTFHDPCYLGRHNGIYDEPRAVLKAIPDAEFVEMPRNREDSLCCGGGGGKIWMEVPAGERLSDFRVQEAIDTGAQILVVDCPYCLTNFEDSRKVLNAEDKIQVMDLVELVKTVI